MFQPMLAGSMWKPSKRPRRGGLILRNRLDWWSTLPLISLKLPFIYTVGVCWCGVLAFALFPSLALNQFFLFAVKCSWCSSEAIQSIESTRSTSTLSTKVDLAGFDCWLFQCSMAHISHWESACITGGTSNVAKTKLSNKAEVQIGGSDAEDDSKTEAAKKAVESMYDGMAPLTHKTEYDDVSESENDEKDNKRKKGKAKPKGEAKSKRKPREKPEETPEAGNHWCDLACSLAILLRLISPYSFWLVQGQASQRREERNG